MVSESNEVTSTFCRTEAIHDCVLRGKIFLEYHYILAFQQYPLKQNETFLFLSILSLLHPLRARVWAQLLSCDCPYCLIASQVLVAGFVSMTSCDHKQFPDTVLGVNVSWEVFLVSTVDNTTLFWSRCEKGRKKLHCRGEMHCATCPWGWKMLLAQVI